MALVPSAMSTRSIGRRPKELVATIFFLQLMGSSSFSPVHLAPHPAPQFDPSARRTRVCLKRPLSQGGSVSALAAAADVTQAVNEFFVTAPYAAAALTCGTKASAADYVAQKRQYGKRDGTENASPEAEQDETASGETKGVSTQSIEDEEKRFQLPRNLAFLLYGAAYQGMGQEFIYNHVYPTLFGEGTSISVVLTKVAFDLCVQTTLLTLPIAYLTKAAIFRYSAGEGLRRYWEDITTHGLLKKYFLLWGPTQCLTFSIIPEHYRVTFVAFISFFWIIILSSISAKPRKAGDLAGLDELEVDGEDIEECLLADGVTCNIDG